MIRLSAFADEISQDLNEQLAVLLSENIHFLDLRSVWNSNVLDLSNEQVQLVKRTLDAHNVGVAAIASPIGKVAIDAPFDAQMQRFERAIALSHIFQTPYIRIFSFYPPRAGHNTMQSAWRDEVIRRLDSMTKRAAEEHLILLHENEKAIYGDTIARCVDLLSSIQNEHLQAAFDPANFIQCEQTPYPDAFEALRPWLHYVHVKDALPDGNVVAAGKGISRWPDILHHLRQDSYDGFLTLEPHLASANQYSGFSGADLFCSASQALQHILQNIGWQYA